MRVRTLGIAAAMLVTACTPGEGPKSIPLPTSPDTTTTTTTTTLPATTTTTSTTSTTSTTVVPPRLTATIRRTTDGVPHISGPDMASVAYGQGWVSADDHGCSLIDQILKIYGVRAANLGPGADGENIESDFAWRSIDITGRAAVDFEGASTELVEVFGAFAEGWNARLADGGLTGWCADAAWVRPVEPVEVYAYSRSLALLASSARLAEFIPSAQPPAADEAPAGFAPAGPAARRSAASRRASSPAAVPDFDVLGPIDAGSNGWAVGADRVAPGVNGLLVANPHFPWEGELRFTEVHLTVPGEFDIYGAQLIGVPGIGLGFTDGVAWTHTVSAGKRMTASLLTLDPESPTAYLVDGESRSMTGTDHTIEILRADGSVDAETRTLWHSHHGPVIDFPGLGWTEEQVLTFRDANLDNDEFVEQYLDMVAVSDLDELIAIHEAHQGVPLFNTIATGADGRVWYADTAATPRLSDEGEAVYLEALFTDVVTQIASNNGIVLLDGSDGRLEWAAVGGARDPGLVPFAEMPQVVRTDYVFNANDSFWVPSAEFTLTGDYSILHGTQNTPLSMRTRQNAAVLSSTSQLGLAGDDGAFTGEELRDAAFDNTSHTALLLLEQTVAACRATPVVDVDEVLDADEVVALPAEAVDLSTACALLATWDGRYDLDSVGPLLWREVMNRFDGAARTNTGVLFGDAFDAAAPTVTPAVPAEDSAPLLRALARAVQTLTKAGFPLDSALGAAQFSERTAARIPVHGGTEADGVTNVVRWSSGNSSTEPQPGRGDPVAPGSSLRGEGHPVNFGTSFVLAVEFRDPAAADVNPDGSDDADGTDDAGDAPVRAWSILTYGQSGNRDAEDFDRQMERFAAKQWRPVAFTDADIAADPNLTERTLVVR